MELEKFNTIAQGIQALAVSLAAIVGVVWGIIKLYISKEIKKARLETDRLKKEFEKREGIEAEIDVQLGSTLENGSIPVFLNLTLINKGAEVLVLNWEKLFPMIISSLEPLQNEYEFRLNLVSRLCYSWGCFNDKNYRWTIDKTTSFLPHQTRKLSFYWECKEPGIYQACVSFKLSDNLQKYINDQDEDKYINLARKNLAEGELPLIEGMNIAVAKYFQVKHNTRSEKSYIKKEQE